MRVSESRMASVMALFGIPSSHINELIGDDHNSVKAEPKMYVAFLSKFYASTDTPQCSSEIKEESKKQAPSTIGNTNDKVPKGSAHCVNCAKKATLRCIKCWNGANQHVAYCSKSCQVADWPSHKNFCASQMPVKRLKSELSPDSIGI